MKKILFIFAFICLFPLAAHSRSFDTSTFNFMTAEGGLHPEAELSAIRLAEKFFDENQTDLDFLGSTKEKISSAIASENWTEVENILSHSLAIINKTQSLFQDNLSIGILGFYLDNIKHGLSAKNVTSMLKNYGIENQGDFKSVFFDGFKNEDKELRQKYLFAFGNIFDSLITHYYDGLQAIAREKAATEFDRIAYSRDARAERKAEAQREIDTRKTFFAGFVPRLGYGLKELLPSLLIGLLIFQALARYSRIKNLDLAGASAALTVCLLAIPFYLLYAFMIIGPWTLRLAPIVIMILLFALPAGFRSRLIGLFTPNRAMQTALSFGENMPDASGIGEGSHGSADWATSGEMQSKGRLEPQEPGLALGRDPGTLKRFWFLGHILTCAPTGSGKGIGAVIPNLLDYPGSVFVNDLKGENYAVTAKQRRALGQTVVKVDPFAVIQEPSASFNPLDTVDLQSEDCISLSSALAGHLVMQEKAGEMSHWDESALNLLQGLILYVKTLAAEKQTLPEVRRLLTSSPDDFSVLLADMSVSDAAFGIIGRAANALVSKPEKERGSIVSTAQRHTQFLDDPRIAVVLSQSDFDLSAIKSQFMSVFVILPPSKLAQNARFVRLLLGCALAAITSSDKKPRYRVGFLLDEFAQLGYMEQIESGISLLRGYGAVFWIFVQDLSQLKGIYKKWQSFLANAAKQFFGTSDFDTAEYVSKSLGQKTIEQVSSSEGGSLRAKLTGGVNKSESISEIGRPLLTPDEVMRLGPEQPIVLLSGERPYLLNRLNYLVDIEYRGLFEQNPYHA